MSGSSSTKTSNTTQNTLPAWVQAAGQDNYNLATSIAATPYNTAQNTSVAGLSDQQKQAMALQGSSVGQAQALTGQAATTQAGLMNYTPQQVSAGTVTPQTVAGTNLSAYENPYTSSVIDATMKSMDQSNAQAKLGNDAQATTAGAFGGSRAAVQNAVTDSQNVLNKANMQSGLLSQNFTQAQAAATGDVTRNQQAQTTNVGNDLTAQQSNQTAGNVGAGINLSAANALVNSGTALQTQNQNDINGLMQTGTVQQTQDQNVLNANTANAKAQQAYTQQGLNTRLSALGMTPYNTTQQSDGTSTTTSSDPLASGLGIAKMGIGLLTASDDDLKTDKVKVGKAPGSDLDLYAYRYKGDPKSYPKVVGLMASDVQKKVPSAVKRLPGKGGKRVVDYTAALKGA